MSKEVPILTQNDFFRFCKEELYKLRDANAGEVVEQAKLLADEIMPLLMSFGYKPGCLTGDPRFLETDFDKSLASFWFIGQFLDIVHSEKWWAMNALLNNLDQLYLQPK